MRRVTDLTLRQEIARIARAPAGVVELLVELLLAEARVGETVEQTTRRVLWRVWCEAGLPPNFFGRAVATDRFLALVMLGRSGAVSARTLAALAAGREGEPDVLAEPTSAA